MTQRAFESLTANALNAGVAWGAVRCRLPPSKNTGSPDRRLRTSRFLSTRKLYCSSPASPLPSRQQPPTALFASPKFEPHIHAFPLSCSMIVRCSWCVPLAVARQRGQDVNFLKQNQTFTSSAKRSCSCSGHVRARPFATCMKAQSNAFRLVPTSEAESPVPVSLNAEVQPCSRIVGYSP